MAEESQHTIPPIPSAARSAVEGLYKHGPQPYEVILTIQQKLFDVNLAAKAAGQKTTNTLIVCEHLHVYTLGKSGDEKNMLFRPDAVGASLYKINRGGDITFHGPGQMVVYPIFDLEMLHVGMAGFIAALEEAVIRTVAHYGITAGRLKGAAGIWLEAETRPRKICAIGMKASRYCTMHGIALNVNTDLKYFDYIVPCGIPDKAVTSLQKELGREVNVNEVRDMFVGELEKVLPIVVSPK